MAPKLDRFAIAAFLAGCLFLALRGWLHDNPQHDPWAPLRIEDPPGWATGRKLAALRSDTSQCRAFLERSRIPAEPLGATGEGACRRTDREVLAGPPSLGVVLDPAGAQATCAVDAALAWWIEQGVQPAALALLGSPVARVRHLGTWNCRRIGGGSQGAWSEHATGNAVDIAGFVLDDGRVVDIRRDWEGSGDAAAFLHLVRDRACRSFATVLSPDYNAAHADHLHLDQARRGGGWTACR